MLLSKLSQYIPKDESIGFKFSRRYDKWEILIDHQPNDEDEESIVNDADNMYEILKTLMPADLIRSWDGSIVGKDNLECSGYILDQKSKHVFEGEVSFNKLLIKETVFNKEIDFYIYLFSQFEEVDLTSKDIKANNLKSPIQILIECIEAEGYTLNGFKYDGLDDDGYSHVAFDLQISEEENIFVKFPQKDAFSYSEFDEDNYLNIKDFDATDIYSYNSEFLEMLQCIDNDDFDSYILDNSWGE